MNDSAETSAGRRYLREATRLVERLLTDEWANIDKAADVVAATLERGGAIHVFGGESQARRETISEVLRLAPGATEWAKATPMPVARNFARAVLFNGDVYVVGGSEQPGSSHSSAGSARVERYRQPGCNG